MKKIFSAIFLVGMAGLANASEIRWVDGNIEFSVASVNKEIAWTDDEKSGLIAKYAAFQATAPIVVEEHAPTESEAMIATLPVKFENCTDFKNSVGGKDLEKKIFQIKQDLESLTDVGETKKAAELDAKYSLIKSLYKVTIPVEVIIK